MAKSLSVLIEEFNAWRSGFRGRVNSDFYAGIAAKPANRLSDGHGLDAERTGRDQWKWDWAESWADAQAFEKAFKDVGYDVGLGGGTSDTRGVYLCLKSERFRR